jgi:sensor histidine kinase YesM
MDRSRQTPGGIPLLAALGVATVLGAIASGEHHLSMLQHGGDPTILHALKMGMPYWFIWILLTPIILWVVDRAPLEGPWSVATVLLHLVVAVVVTMLHSALQNLIVLAFGIIRFPSLHALLAGLLGAGVRSLTFDLPAYGAILALLYAIGYYRRFRERERAAAELEVQLARAQLEALRSQLNPHFFFNAMNSVAMLVRAQRNDEAVRSLAGLSELMRYVLQDHPAAEVPLAEELGFLQRYLAIERVRFQDRLRVVVEAAPDTPDAWVPNLVLQPLVENAIRHGIGRRAAASLVEITAARDGDRLLLTVRDDGPGLNGTKTPAPSTGVGLRNIRERLTRLYGTEQSLELREAEGGGVVARISLPFHTQPATPVLATV